MKKVLLPLFILPLWFTVSAQSYTAFPDGNASWKVIRCFYFYPPDGYDLFTYDQLGDTLISNVSWHKLYLTVHHLPGSIYDTTYTVYYGGIREEQKKIYVFSQYAFGDSQERLAYDFNKQTPGDTITTDLLTYGDANPVKNIVLSVDSVLIGGSYHRRIKLSDISGNPTLERWTEGIGSNFGLVYASFYLLTDNSYDLRCYADEETSYQNNQLLLGYCQLPPQVECGFATGISLTSDPSHFLLFPNPATNVIYVRGLIPFEGTLNVVLYGVRGEVLSRQTLPAGDLFEIDVEKLPAGPYWIQVILNNGRRETLAFVKESE